MLVPPHGQFPLALLVLSVHPWELLSSEGIARGAHMVEASSLFLDQVWMIPERLVLGPLSFWFCHEGKWGRFPLTHGQRINGREERGREEVIENDH